MEMGVINARPQPVPERRLRRGSLIGFSLSIGFLAVPEGDSVRDAGHSRRDYTFPDGRFSSHLLRP